MFWVGDIAFEGGIAEFNLCGRCGAAVGNPRLHATWHAEAEEAVREAVGEAAVKLLAQLRESPVLDVAGA